MSKASARRPGRVIRRAIVAALLFLAVVPAGAQEPAPSDTVRTNIWLVESLMEDIVTATIHVLPASPAVILLEPQSPGEETELFTGVVFRVLAGRGYEMVKADVEDEEAPLPPHDLRYSYRVAGVDLAYPEVGRTLGLWRRWVGRDLEVSSYIQVVETGSGRVLLSSRVARSFSDRVPSDDFDDVNSNLYSFTTAETGESGWQRRLEEIVVLGALAALVAIYFANTAN